MRCLQCGKAIPLLKRLGGSSEFCSEAHRREYQHEFSQLALGRLLQSQPAEFQAQAERAAILAAATATTLNPHANPLIGPPGVNGTPAEKPSAAPVLAPATTLSAPAVKPDSRAKSDLPPMQPSTMNGATQPPATQPTGQPTFSQPVAAPPAIIQKPAPAELQFALKAAPEFEHAFASLAVNPPHHQRDTSPAELPQGRTVVWAGAVEIANSITLPMESKMDLREMSRTTPRIALDLRIVAPESLEPESLQMESRPFTIPAIPAVPVVASLSIETFCDFTGDLVSLSDFANVQFAKSDFEVPAIARDSAVGVVAEPPAASEPHLAAIYTQPAPAELHSDAPRPQVHIPDLQLDPMPVNSTGMAPGKAKALPAFGPVSIGTGTVEIPQPIRLPLRPLMVLAPASPPPPEVKQRNSDVKISRSPLSIKPDPQPSTTVSAPSPELDRSSRFALSIKPELRTSTPPAARSSELDRGSRSALAAKTEVQPVSPELNLGLPELRMSTSNERTLIGKIIAAVTGAVVLGATLFFFLGRPSEAGSKSPAPAVNAQSSQWISNFAPDAKRQRRVSLLRSSMNMPAYRLDFESSIQMKALGWVYRARDPHNFYVSKIEFKKPGVQPVYVLVHYAVINGVDQQRVETPLPVSVPMGGLYKIHFEAVGNRFTTWVQGQQVEQWTDARLSSGASGLYGEGSEQSVLHGDFVVTPLQN